MDTNKTTDIPQNEINHSQIPSIEDLKESTKTGILEAFYQDEWVLGKVFSIITGKKINPADLIEKIEVVRHEYQKSTPEASNDEISEQAA